MTEQVSQPEFDRTGERRVFNLDLLTDDQVIWLTRAVCNEYERSLGTHEPVMGEGFMDVLQGDLENLMSLDPARARSLFSQLAEGSRNEREMVADCVPRLAEHDYEFARDLLLSMDDRERDSDSGDSDSNVLEAITSAADRIRDNLSEQQVADFNVHWEPHTH